MEHKNSNEAVGNYGVYEITIDGVTYKIGKADLDRITLSTNTPTRIHQQIVKLEKINTEKSVFHKILKSLFGAKTKTAKSIEQKILQQLFESNGIVPEGNKNSFKPETD